MKNMHDASPLRSFSFIFTAVFVFLSVIAALHDVLLFFSVSQWICWSLCHPLLLFIQSSWANVNMIERAHVLCFSVFFFLFFFSSFWWFEFLWLLLLCHVSMSVLSRCLCIRWCILVINQMENSLKLSHCTKWPLRRFCALCALIYMRRMWNYLL